MPPRLSLAALFLVTTSCFATTDLDRFETKLRVQGNFVDLRLTFRGMDSHVSEYVEYRVVDGENFLQSRGIFRPLGGVNVTVFAPGALPRLNGPYTLEFFADHDRDGSYTRPSPTGNYPDHSWTLALDPDKANDDGLLELVFDHNTSFQDIDAPEPARTVGTPATIHLVNLAGLLGKRLEVRVADANSKRVVALYRNPLVNTPAFDAVIEGMIDGGVNYAIEVYTDDGNATPSSIQAFRFEQPSDATGLVAEFDPATAPVVTDAPPP